MKSLSSAIFAIALLMAFAKPESAATNCPATIDSSTCFYLDTMPNTRIASVHCYIWKHNFYIYDGCPWNSGDSVLINRCVEAKNDTGLKYLSSHYYAITNLFQKYQLFSVWDKTTRLDTNNVDSIGIPCARIGRCKPELQVGAATFWYTIAATKQTILQMASDSVVGGIEKYYPPLTATIKNAFYAHHAGKNRFDSELSFYDIRGRILSSNVKNDGISNLVVGVQNGYIRIVSPFSNLHK